MRVATQTRVQKYPERPRTLFLLAATSGIQAGPSPSAPEFLVSPLDAETGIFKRILHIFTITIHSYRKPRINHENTRRTFELSECSVVFSASFVSMLLPL